MDFSAEGKIKIRVEITVEEKCQTKKHQYIRHLIFLQNKLPLCRVYSRKQWG